jgi:predicted DNA binding CopG/RHH family protein
MKKANTKTRNAQAQVRRTQIGAARPDEQIDTSDIPEITDWTGAVRGLFARPQTRQISIRLGAADLVTASRLAARKGLPYQTYIKSLLHEALENEIRRLPH